MALVSFHQNNLKIELANVLGKKRGKSAAPSGGYCFDFDGNFVIYGPLM